MHAFEGGVEHPDDVTLSRVCGAAMVHLSISSLFWKLTQSVIMYCLKDAGIGVYPFHSGILNLDQASKLLFQAQTTKNIYRRSCKEGRYK